MIHKVNIIFNKQNCLKINKFNVIASKKNEKIHIHYVKLKNNFFLPL